MEPAAANLSRTAVVPAPVPPGPVTVVVPVYELEPEKIIVPLLFALKLTLPVPSIAPDNVRGDVLTPLFLSRKFVDPKLQLPLLTTGVSASAAKLIPELTAAPPIMKLFGMVTVVPPAPSSGMKPVAELRLLTMSPVPNEALLLKWISVPVEVSEVPPE